jgi:hypothetical protein
MLALFGKMFSERACQSFERALIAKALLSFSDPLSQMSQKKLRMSQKN